MDTSRLAIQLCIQGTQAEFQGRLAEASGLYQQAWKVAKDDFDRCVAAHYVARFQETPELRLHWNQEDLNRANAVERERVKEFYPSLLLNMGQSYEQLGNQDEAKRYYDLAAALGAVHQACSR